MDPIDRDDFDERRGREPNPERINAIKEYARQKRAANAALEYEIREAYDTGHSYRQLAEAAGVSVTVIQRIMRGYNNDEQE